MGAPAGEACHACADLTVRPPGTRAVVPSGYTDVGGRLHLSFSLFHSPFCQAPHAAPCPVMCTLGLFPSRDISRVGQLTCRQRDPAGLEVCARRLARSGDLEPQPLRLMRGIPTLPFRATRRVNHHSLISRPE